LTQTSQAQSRLDEMTASLVGRLVFITPRRAKLLETLAGTDSYPSVSELHAQVQPRYLSTRLATVYNTIELLKECGQVLEMEFSGSANRYDGRGATPHPRVVCLECECIDDAEIIDSDGSYASIAQTTGYEVSSHRLEFYGTCPVCQARSGGGA
jgi:Fur family peroxide stress response transcriptional regulator